MPRTLDLYKTRIGHFFFHEKCIGKRGCIVKCSPDEEYLYLDLFKEMGEILVNRLYKTASHNRGCL